MFVLALVGCGNWIDKPPACELDVYGWSDDLMSHIVKGDGSGAFDYDPEDDYRDGISGGYDPRDGEFEWEVDYADGFYLTSARVSGYGTAYHDGDLDIIYDMETTDKLDVTTLTSYRIVREGCEMTTWDWDTEGAEEAGEEQSGEYVSASQFEWSGSDDRADYAGVRTDELDVSRGYETRDGDFNIWTTLSADGTEHLEWYAADASHCVDDLDVDAATCEGAKDVAFSGDYTYEQRIVDESGDVVYEMHGDFDYAGDGTETQTIYGGDGDVGCVFTVKNGTCKYECDDGQSGRCD